MSLEEKKLVIGVDIDNTLTWNLPMMLEQAKIFCKEIGHTYDFNSGIKSPSPATLFGFNKEQADEFNKRTCMNNMRNVEPDTFCVDVMERLYRKYVILIITGRPDKGEICPGYTGEQLKEDTLNWFKNHKIQYYGIAFNVQDKGEYCKTHGVDIMIDDNTGYINQCIDKDITTIVRARPYNQMYADDPRVMYATNFVEVEEMIDGYATHKYTAEAVMEAGSDIVKESKFKPETPRIGAKTFFVSDIHLGKPNLGCGEDYHEVINERVSEDDTIIFVGDIGFKKDEFRIQKLTNFFTNIKCKHMFLVLGNHDLDSIDKYYAMGFKGVFKKIITKNYVITHVPTRVESGLINICGHIHGAGEYWGISQDAKQINVFWKLIDGPRRLEELLEMQKDGLFNGEIKSDVKWKTTLPNAPVLHIESVQKSSLFTDVNQLKFAIKTFNNVDPTSQKELASIILESMDNFNIPKSIIGRGNDLSDYIRESDENMSIFTNPDMITESVTKFVNDEGKSVPHKCLKCGSDVKVYIRGEPVYLCSNPKCAKCYGVVPFS